MKPRVWAARCAIPTLMVETIAVVPIVTVRGLEAVQLFMETIVLKHVFSRKYGASHVFSPYGRDYTVVQGTLLSFVVIAILVSTLMDVAYRFVDPRVKFD